MRTTGMTTSLNKDGEEQSDAQPQPPGTFPNKDGEGKPVGERRVPEDGGSVHPLGAYRDAAPELLRELAHLLGRYRWPEEGCVPRGLVNILSGAAQDLTHGAGAHGGTGPSLTLKSRCPVVVDEKTQKEVVVVDDDHQRKTTKKKSPPKLSREKKVKGRPDVPTTSGSPHAHRDRANGSSTITFSMSSKSCKDQGWVVEPAEEASNEEPQKSAVWQWVLQRLQTAQKHIQLQAAQDGERGRDKPPVVRHYGEVRPYYRNKRAADKSLPSALIDGMPQIPQVKREDPSKRKLHYAINDGSSVLYYPSGGVAVCQSGSGLPRGGFYTNVFSDGAGPAVVASITASGRGAVTHHVSSDVSFSSGAVSAVWDRGGGVICGPDGTVTKEWSWQSGSGSKERVVIQVSKSISVKLLNGTSGLLCFRSQGEIIQLPLSALQSDVTPPTDTSCPKPNQRFVSHKELMLAKKRRLPGHAAESEDLSVNTASVRQREVLQMVREVEGPEEPGVVWGGGGGGGGGGRGHVEELERELKRLQRKVRNTLDDWLELYRTATGIRCPDIERTPDAPQRSRSRREARSAAAAALPSLNPPGWGDTQPGAPPADPARHPSAPEDRLPGSAAAEGPRIPRKPLKEESHVTQIGALCIHSNVRLESVVTPESPPRPPAGSADVHPAGRPSSATSSPCPVLLRATVHGGGGWEGQARDGGLGRHRRRRCCCSSRLMPLVTDLEFDAFVRGQAARGEQVLVVCVSRPGGHDDTLERLHEQRSGNRSMPCVQCQMDPFRLVRYEVSAGRTSSARRSLLQLRHNVSPGMLLMYVGGKLLFADHISAGPRCSVRDLQRQVSTSRQDYKLGLSLPADYKFGAKLKSSVAADSLTTQESQQISTMSSLDSSSTRLRRSHQDEVKTPQQEGRKFKRSPAVPHIPLAKH
ncbi:unnamed protein product [Merluccius merluccius]